MVTWEYLNHCNRKYNEVTNDVLSCLKFDDKCMGESMPSYLIDEKLFLKRQ